MGASKAIAAPRMESPPAFQTTPTALPYPILRRLSSQSTPGQGPQPGGCSRVCHGAIWRWTALTARGSDATYMELLSRVVYLMNPILRGWVTYFAIGDASRCFGSGMCVTGWKRRGGAI